MMKCIVVEDEKRVQENIQNVIRKLSIEKDIDLDVKYYKKFTKELEEEINEELYRKVYIMDIELESGPSGIEIAKKIREKDWESEIIFVTNHDKMFETVHRKVLDVFDFIEKFDNMEDRIEKDILTIYNQKFDKKMLKILARNADLEIYYKNINYIARDKEERKLIIYCNDVTFKINESLNDLLEKLDNRFIRVHRSCIVNKENVVLYNYKEGYFMLKNGEKVPLLSKKYRKEIEEKC